MADIQQPEVEALLGRNPVSEADILSWLADTWQYFLDSGLYFAGGPADDRTVYRLQLIERAQALAEEYASPGVSAEANRISAHVMNASEQYQQAVAYYAKAIPQLEALHRTDEAIRTRLGYGAALMMSGQYPNALQTLQEAQSWFESHDDQAGLARVLINTGNVYHRMDEHNQALQYQIQAAEIFESIGSNTDLAVLAHNIANGFAFLDRFEEADDKYRQSYEIAAANDMDSLADQARYNRAYLSFLRGRYSEAISGFNQLRESFLASKMHAPRCPL
ncbi:MAG: tetratricopeptide repeat protein [Pseudomonadales bacterium]